MSRDNNGGNRDAQKEALPEIVKRSYSADPKTQEVLRDADKTINDISLPKVTDSLLQREMERRAAARSAAAIANTTTTSSPSVLASSSSSPSVAVSSSSSSSTMQSQSVADAASSSTRAQRIRNTGVRGVAEAGSSSKSAEQIAKERADRAAFLNRKTSNSRGSGIGGVFQ